MVSDYEGTRRKEEDMRVSTSTGMCYNVLLQKEMYYSCQESIEAIAQAGYQAMDINLHDYREQLSQPDWRDWCVRHREVAREYGLEVTQGHAHMYGAFDFYNYTQEEIDYHTSLVERDIEAAALFGVSWLTIHPDSYLDDTWYSHKRSMEKNVERFQRYGEIAARCGVGIAIENMIDKRSLRRFGASTEDLLELLDRLGDDSLFGICWDTGHANLHQINQAKALGEIGHRLKSVHINDNHGVNDEHLIPYQGTIDWREVVRALKTIGYQGDFTFEIHTFTRGYDPGFHHEAMAYARRLGEFLITLE